MAAIAEIIVMPNASAPMVSGMLAEPGGATAAKSAGSMAVIVVPTFCAIAIALTRVLVWKSSGTRTRVSAMAIAQNVGTTITAMLPALFAAVAPPGSANIPLTIGALAFGITIISAIAAITARETYRFHLNDLGRLEAVPVPKPDYDRMREQSLGKSRLAYP